MGMTVLLFRKHGDDCTRLAWKMPTYRASQLRRGGPDSMKTSYQSSGKAWLKIKTLTAKHYHKDR